MEEAVRLSNHLLEQIYRNNIYVIHLSRDPFGESNIVSYQVWASKIVYSIQLAVIDRNGRTLTAWVKYDFPYFGSPGIVHLLIFDLTRRLLEWRREWN
ncbi:hypothetical protein AXF42_Ash021499 [Apostasia shenzhenica]|uniref:Uncharacterized protein n=1 Tax=Apostasia shenzhenica TaxID=1088818 RepID=A0A2H9ZUC2_9ASPA|nr:hypothetical protein AXF42_Ash021499 [Apostasia shenzhenica]